MAQGMAQATMKMGDDPHLALNVVVELDQGQPATASEDEPEPSASRWFKGDHKVPTAETP